MHGRNRFSLKGGAAETFLEKKERFLPPKPMRKLLILLALILIAAGVANGGAWDVLVKATNICTECIGLG